jgi:hypothetical protein
MKLQAKLNMQLWDPNRRMTPTGILYRGDVVDLVGPAKGAGKAYGYVTVLIEGVEHLAFSANFNRTEAS